MYYPAILCTRNYNPDVLEKGMVFLGVNNEQEINIWELQENVNDEDTFISKHGFPVQFYITDGYEDVIVEEDKIGWMEEDDNNNLHELSLQEINYILNECEGNIEIKIKDEGWNIIPEYVEDKVVIRMAKYEQ